MTGSLQSRQVSLFTPSGWKLREKKKKIPIKIEENEIISCRSRKTEHDNIEESDTQPEERQERRRDEAQ